MRMFHTIIILSYTIPALYLFIRIWQLFIEKKHRLKFIFIYAILFSLYPISMSIEDNYGRVSGILETVSGYLLPFFLYLFLLLLLTDILLLTNIILRVVDRERIRQKHFRKRIIITLISLSILIVIFGVINFNTIRITEYNVELSGKKSKTDHLRIAFVSDFHLDGTTPERFVRKFVKKVNEAAPDLMLYGGDILEGSGEGRKMHDFENIFREVSPTFGSFAILGNHDRIFRDDYDNFFNRAGITLVRDSVIFFDSSFALAGRRDPREGRLNIEDLLASVPRDLPLIVLDHRPVENEQISKTTADVVLSGHTHNGQLFPINLITRRVYELSYGHIKKGNTNIFVSSGIRLWGPPVRTTSKSEIVIVNLIFR